MNNNNLYFINNNYETIYEEIERINKSYLFQQEYLLNMINNLSYLNNMKIYQDNKTFYLNLLNNLKSVKTELDRYSQKIVIKNLTDKTVSDYVVNSMYINSLLIKYSNQIAPDNINNILTLFIGKNWEHKFNKLELDKLLFIIQFIKPIFLWDSLYHEETKPESPKNKIDKELQSSEIVTKDIIESILMQTSNLKPKNNIISKSNSNSISSFLKSINELVETIPIKRTYNYKMRDCVNILGELRVKIIKINKPQTFLEDRYGVECYINYYNRVIVIQGLVKDDILNISSSFKFIKNKLNSIKSIISYDIPSISKNFKDSYLKILNLKDILCLSNNEIIEDIKKKYIDFKLIQNKPLVNLINEFIITNKYRKIEILTLLLTSNEDDKTIASILFDVLKNKDKSTKQQDILTEVYYGLHYSVREILNYTNQKLEKEEQELNKITETDIPYEKRINLMKTTDDVKIKAMDKYKLIKSSVQGDGKAQQWLDGLLKIPFGKYSQNEILSFKSEFLNKLVQNNLNEKKLFSES
jgi:hypothetical protein